jgi:regulatory protein YycH of two-component signal transduction system YycFG
MSFVLTWNIWFFQTDFEGNSPNTNAIQNPVAIAESRDLDQVVKPYLTIMHKDGQLLGQNNSESVSKVYSLFEQGQFSNIIPVTSDKKLPDHDGAPSYEIVFPAPLTTDALMKLFTINTDNYKLKKNLLISRIEIYNSDQDQRDIAVFRQDNGNAAFYTSVTNIKLDSLNKAMNSGNLTTYEIRQLKDKAVFLPREKTSVKQMVYLYSELPFQSFAKVLFNNINKAVHHSDSYSALTQQLEKNGYTIQYVDVKPNILGAAPELEDTLLHSFDFVNSHKGWTNDYIYDYLKLSSNNKHNEVNFRMMIDDYPLYSTESYPNLYLPSINIVWKSGKLYQLNRNILKINRVTSSNANALESGSAALEEIFANRNLKASDIDDLKIGYEMNFTENSNTIQLIPNWFYNQDGKWHSLSEFNKPKKSIEGGASSS